MKKQFTSKSPSVACQGVSQNPCGQFVISWIKSTVSLQFNAPLIKVLLLILCIIGFVEVSAQNQIVTENTKTGNPASEWQISRAGDLTIQGFATDISYNKGQTARFKIKTDAGNYTVRIFRLGYYQGNGARLQGTATVTANLPQNQPLCHTESATGLIDCGNWAESAHWTIPSDAISGVYIAKLTRTDNNGSSHIVFIVRDDASTSDLLFQTSDATWQAYNIYGDNSNGKSLYKGISGSKAVKVSYNRPFITRSGGGGGGAEEDWLFNAEYPMIRWLEANGYDVTYTTNVDSDRRGNLIANHKVFLSVGHDEYWSGQHRAKVTAARDAGTHLAFFSGNEVYWRTRWENSIDGNGIPYRTLVCYKEGTSGENTCNGKCDPSPEWTGLWRTGCEFLTGDPLLDGCQPENALTGQISWELSNASLQVPSTFKNLRFWRNTSVASLSDGQTASFTYATIGYEWNSEQEAYRSSYPSGRILLSSTVIGGKYHHLSLYRHSNGALVFGAGTVQYSWGLDSNHDRGNAAPSPALQQATVNLFADMSVQPATIQSGLVAATASTDVQAPTVTISEPLDGASFPAGNTVNISGTASDDNVLVGVEVSTDGGTTWNAATGTSSWSYSWAPTTQGAFTIKSRAFDDSGNMGTPATVNVTIGESEPVTCPCTVFSASTVPTGSTVNDGQPVQVGMKFRAGVNGFASAVRFYKQSGHNGTHTGQLHSSSGTLLASAVFINETASGWQEVLFDSPVAITAGTTYIVSYHSSEGNYSVDDYGFDQAIYNGPLTGLQNGLDGPNGIYIFTSTPAFPTNNYLSSNYFVDVVFSTDGEPSNQLPTVSLTAPTNNATFTAPANITLEAAASDPDGTVSKVEFFWDTTKLGEDTDGSNGWNYVWVGVEAGSYQLTARATDNAAGVTTSSVTNITVSGDQQEACPCTVFDSNAAPDGILLNDGRAVQVGMKFRANVSGLVTGGRFYKQMGNNGTHIGLLYNSSGTLLASATFVNETASGWQEVVFSSPVAITADVTYVISYHSSAGYYSVNEWGFGQAIINGPLTGLQNGTDGANGIYRYTTKPAFPNRNYRSSNYWVDVIFTTETTPVNQAPSVAITTPADNASFTAPSDITIEAISSDTDGTVSKVEFYQGTIKLGEDISSPYSYNWTNVAAGSYVLTARATDNASGTTISPPVNITVNEGANQLPTVSITAPADNATFTEPATVEITAIASDADGSVSKVEFFQGTVNLGEDINSPYTYSWTNVTAGSYVLTAKATDNVGGTTISPPVNITVQTDSQEGCPCTVFPDTAAPSGSLSNDGQPVQLGMKFRANIGGFVTGVRFYKQSGNNGTHTGQLYSRAGTLLASATFANETASGWQEAAFASPVAVTAGTTYMISYHSSEGNYSVDDHGFDQATVNEPLRGLANGEDGFNGMYRYTNTPAFPTSNYLSSNYFVDVVFNTDQISLANARISGNSKPDIKDFSLNWDKERSDGISLKVFPNPTEGNILHIVAQGFRSEEEPIFLLYNNSGSIVTHLNANADHNGIITKDIELAQGLASGSYFLVLRTRTNMIIRKVIITY